MVGHERHLTSINLKTFSFIDIKRGLSLSKPYAAYHMLSQKFQVDFFISDFKSFHKKKDSHLSSNLTLALKSEIVIFSIVIS